MQLSNKGRRRSSHVRDTTLPERDQGRLDEGAGAPASFELNLSVAATSLVSVLYFDLAMPEGTTISIAANGFANAEITASGSDIAIIVGS